MHQSRLKKVNAKAKFWMHMVIQAHSHLKIYKNISNLTNFITIKQSFCQIVQLQ